MQVIAARVRVVDLAGLSLHFAQRRQRAESTLVSKEEQWRLRIVPRFAGRVAESVTHDEAQDAAAHWAAQHGPHAAQKAVREAGHGWRLAMRRDWLRRSPWDGVQAPGATRSPQRVMPRADREQLAAYLEPIALRGVRARFRRSGALALLTLAETPAGRVAETAALEQSAVDLRAGIVTWNRHKTARRTGPKRSPITPYQAAIFQAAALAFPGARWCFPSASGNGHVRDLCKTMGRVCAHVGLPHYSPHDLRRGIATEAIEAGAALEDVQALLGHESIRTTEQYLGWTPRRAASALRLVTLGEQK